MRHIQVVLLFRRRHHLDNSARTVAHSLRSGGEDTSLPLSVKVMFIYMQIAKSDKGRHLSPYPHLKYGQGSSLLDETVCFEVQSAIKPTRGDAMRNHPKNARSDSAVDAWAIFFLILLVVAAAVFWVSGQ